MEKVRMLKIHEGKIILKKVMVGNDDENEVTKTMLKLENWLNDKIATKAHVKFGIMLRVHL
jgi:hypothetical protein